MPPITLKCKGKKRHEKYLIMGNNLRSRCCYSETLRHMESWTWSQWSQTSNYKQIGFCHNIEPLSPGIVVLTFTPPRVQDNPYLIWTSSDLIIMILKGINWTTYWNLNRWSQTLKLLKTDKVLYLDQTNQHTLLSLSWTVKHSPLHFLN